jgi:hypothetical protein
MSGRDVATAHLSVSVNLTSLSEATGSTAIDLIRRLEIREEPSRVLNATGVILAPGER